MHIYLPIAEIPVNIFLIISLGLITGVLSGMFGVGGGFLMTPLLIFIGISPAVAVASSANQIMAASFSGFLSHWKRAQVDFKIGLLLLVGGLIGSSTGVWIFSILKNIGQIDLVISVSYVVFLGTIGSFMLVEATKSVVRSRQGNSTASTKNNIFHDLPLPWVMDFPQSNIRISILLPLLIGFLSGVLVSLMGIGGGFVLIPAMIYILGMPTSVVIGTSLFQIIFITANVTILQSITTQTVDIILASLLLLGSVVGAQFGLRIGAKLNAEILRLLLATLVVIVAFKLGSSLVIEPDNHYEVIEIAQ